MLLEFPTDKLLIDMHLRMYSVYKSKFACSSEYSMGPVNWIKLNDSEFFRFEIENQWQSPILWAFTLVGMSRSWFRFLELISLISSESSKDLIFMYLSMWLLTGSDWKYSSARTRSWL